MILKGSTATTRRVTCTTATVRQTLHPDNSPASAFSLSYVPEITVVSSDSTSVVNVDDATYTRHTGATTKTEATLATAAAATATQTYTYESLTPLIGTIDSETLYVTRVSDGTCVIQVTNNFGLVRQISIPLSQTTPTVIDVFTGYASGSFAKACCDAIDDRLDGLTASTTTKNRYTTGTTPNASNFVADIDWSGVSFAPTGSSWRVTLISPIHGLCATHVAPAIGAAYQFKGSNGTVYNRTVSAKESLGSIGPGIGYDNDFTVVKFDSDLPVEVAWYKMLPTDWKDYAPGFAVGIPAVGFNSERNFVTELFIDSPSLRFKSSAIDAKRAEFFEAFANSSNPIFLIPDYADPILMTTQSTNNSAGPNSVTLRSAMNAAMTTLGGGYQITDYDMTGHTAF